MKTKRGRQSIILTFVLMLLFSSFKVISVASVEKLDKALNDSYIANGAVEVKSARADNGIVGANAAKPFMVIGLLTWPMKLILMALLSLRIQLTQLMEPTLSVAVAPSMDQII